MMASPRPASNSSTSIAVDRSRTNLVPDGSTPASRMRPAVNSYGALPPAPGREDGLPGEPAQGEVRGRLPGDDGHRELVVQLPDHRVVPPGAGEHRRHPQPAEGDVRSAALQVVQHPGPRVPGDVGHLQVVGGEQAPGLGVVLGQVVQAAGGGGDLQVLHDISFRRAGTGAL